MHKRGTVLKGYEIATERLLNYDVQMQLGRRKMKISGIS